MSSSLLAAAGILAAAAALMHFAGNAATLQAPLAPACGPARPAKARAKALALASAPSSGTRRDLAATRSSAGSRAQNAALQDELAPWLARFDEASADQRRGAAVIRRISELPPDEGLRIVRGSWPHLSVWLKEQTIRAFATHGGHLYALEILDLGASEVHASVRRSAFECLEPYAFQDFQSAPARYRSWSREYVGRPLAEVLEENAQRFAGELLALPLEALAPRLGEIQIEPRKGAVAGLDLARVLRAAGALRIVEKCLALGDEPLRAMALFWVADLRPGEVWLREWVVPDMQRSAAVDANLHYHLRLLADESCGWAREPLLDYLREAALSGNRSSAADAAHTLSKIGDVRAIPGLIEVLLLDESGELDRPIGHFGLGKLTGVAWKQDRGGEWWRVWWEENRSRYPHQVRSMRVSR